MSMFCFQCQEAAGNTGCTVRGVCGKPEGLARDQDLLVWVTQGLAAKAVAALGLGSSVPTDTVAFIVESLFMTITNANFDDEAIRRRVKATIVRSSALSPLAGGSQDLPKAASWSQTDDLALDAQAAVVGTLAETDENVRSLLALALFGLKGLAAYLHHAAALDAVDRGLNATFLGYVATLAAPPRDLGVLTQLVLDIGKAGVSAMALLDGANTGAYGNPEITHVNLGVRTRPGILVSGHDLRDLEDLLEQTKDAGVDVYTHSEMLPAHSYPRFKAYPHLVGNYGSSWWHQKEDFEAFGGPILMTTNCIVPPPETATYKDKLFTTGSAGYPGAVHIADRPEGVRGSGNRKDFSPIIALAQLCPPPKPLETGTLVAGFAHAQVLALADQVIAAVKSGALRKFVVMAGCDGRMKGRSYYTDFARALSPDTVILTAGCAKYRYNKLGLDDIGGIPRVLDAGQCNDSYSLVKVALALKDAFGLADVNDLPIVYNIAWYEQKAVIVLLALLSLGVKNIHLGPTLPAFLSPAVADVLVKTFGIAGIGTVEDDVKTLVG
jgi:hydroxylamine reductase